MRKIRCGECGKKELKMLSAKGKKFPYKMYPSVELSVDIDFLTCIHCDNIILRPNDCKRLDEAIEKSLSKLRSCSDCDALELGDELEFEDYFDNGIEELLCHSCTNKRTPTSFYDKA